jgi:hypothetical protein
MAPPATPPAGFDPEAHASTDFTPETMIPDGVTTFTDWVVTKRQAAADSPITCWHCYTDGSVTWCVEITCPFPQPPKIKTQ